MKGITMPRMTRRMILDEVKDECQHQAMLLGDIKQNNAAGWLQSLECHMKEAVQPLCDEGACERLNRRLIQLAALAVRAVENMEPIKEA